MMVGAFKGTVYAVEYWIQQDSRVLIHDPCHPHQKVNKLTVCGPMPGCS